jgi:hypothetical protein
MSEHKDGALIGYARVSTGKQDLALQLDALNQVGCARVFADTASGSLRTRPELDKCLDYLRAGDTLVVGKLNRLGRSHRHLLDTVAALGGRGVGFRSLHDPIDTSTAAGKLVFNLFAALAEGTDHASLQMLNWDGTFLRERVDRHQGRQRNWARTTPPTTPTNQPHQQAQPWVEKVARSINDSDTPQW